MRIIFIHNSLVIGGIESVLITYVNMLKKAGYSIDLFLIYDLEDENHGIKEIDKNINIEFSLKKRDLHNIETKRKKRKNNIFRKLNYEITKNIYKSKIKKDIFAKLSTNNYDFVIDFSDCLSKIIKHKKIRKMTNAKILRWQHSQIIEQNIHKTLEGYKEFDQVITVSSEMKKKISDYAYQLNNKIEYLHNPINIQKIREKSNSKSIEKLSNDYLLIVTRIVEGKGLLELIEIYNILKYRYNIINKLYILGDGDYYKTLKEEIKKRNLDKYCILLGRKENPYPYMKNAKLFLFTSESEGLPTVLLESMALGTPVISMNCSTGPTEIIGKNDEYGKLIQLHDKNKFCSAVHELLNNPVLYQHYVEKSLERSSDFSEENIEIKIKNLFHKLLQ